MKGEFNYEENIKFILSSVILTEFTTKFIKFLPSSEYVTVSPMPYTLDLQK